jgi:phenylalanyl-tRNA synthetase alpha chain
MDEKMIQSIKETFTASIAAVVSNDDLVKLQSDYLGKKGRVNELFTQIQKIEDSDLKKNSFQLGNALKNEIDLAIAQRSQELDEQHAASQWHDMSLKTTMYPKGSLHMVTHAIREVRSIFLRLGFIQQTYRETEWEYFAFDALNMPKIHPARDDFETFFISGDEDPTYGKQVLTPHTSSGQVREMLRVGKPPINMINIHRCYRPNWDATHVPMFHQFEGLCVDEGITIAHLKGTIEFFAKSFFGEDREIRLRPYNFRFTEPSFEVDITCGVCDGTGKTAEGKCKICKQGWLELGGAGMVHPNVLTEGKIDPEIYSGWAFGFGIERVYMMKNGINIDDIRIMYGGVVSFLEQFSQIL